MWATEAVKNSIFITGLVMIMMFLIEYFNVLTKGDGFKNLMKNHNLQILLCALLGLIPGCAGGFVVVSLYAHNMVGFGALMAMLVTTIGDDGIVMLAMIPKTALLLSFKLFFLGIIVGYLCDKFVKNVPGPFQSSHFSIHHHHECGDCECEENTRSFHWQRVVLMAGMILFGACVLLGILNHEHGGALAEEAEHVHQHAHAFHEHHHEGIFEDATVNIIFASLALLSFLLTLFASDHFVKEHLWNHIIKHHFVRIFSWTLGALLIIGLLLNYIDLEQWIQHKYVFTLLIAIAVGIIPQSGPNMLFISLFATGNLPISILAANSLVQDGHASLPLLAETKKGFLLSKALKIVAAIAFALLIELFTA